MQKIPKLNQAEFRNNVIFNRQSLKNGPSNLNKDNESKFKGCKNQRSNEPKLVKMPSIKMYEEDAFKEIDVPDKEDLKAKNVLTKQKLNQLISNCENLQRRTI